MAAFSPKFNSAVVLGLAVVTGIASLAATRRADGFLADRLFAILGSSKIGARDLDEDASIMRRIDLRLLIPIKDAIIKSKAFEFESVGYIN